MDRVDRITPPAIRKLTQVQLRQPDLAYTINGIPVYLMSGGSQDIIKVELVFRTGSIDQHKPLQAFAATHLLKNGTQSHTAAQINNILDFYGVAFQAEAQKDIISVGFFSLTKHLEPALDLLFELLSNAVYPESELEILLRNRKQKHIVNQQKISHICRVNFNEKLFGYKHPYGQILQLEDFANLTRSDVVEFYNSFLHPVKCSVFIAGVYPENIVNQIDNKLNRYPWPEKGKEKSLKALIQPENNIGRYFHERSESIQSAIRIGCIMPPRQHPQHYKVTFVNTLLGGYFGSRLMQNLRQEKGFTYGINSAVVSLLQTSYFFISTQVGKQFKERAIEEIFNELDGLKEKPADFNEISLLKNQLASSFIRSFDGPFAQLERFREQLLFGLDYSSCNQYLSHVDAITPENLIETAETWFKDDFIIQYVVG